jgi:hypothetical protein
LAGAELALARATQREKAALASAQAAHREYLGAIRNRDAAAAKAAAALAVYRRAMQAAQAAPRVGSGAVFEAVSEAWSSMTWTLYDHHNRVDAQAGRYQFDCVGMTNYFLKTAAPEANAELRKVEASRLGGYRNPTRWSTSSDEFPPAVLPDGSRSSRQTASGQVTCWRLAVADAMSATRPSPRGPPPGFRTVPTRWSSTTRPA